MRYHLPAMAAAWALCLAASSPAQNIHHIVESPTGDKSFGFNVLALGDVDGDGLDDYGVCERLGNTNGVYAYSGATGAQVGPFVSGPNLGSYSSFLGIGDANGDGRGDVAHAEGPELVLNSAYDGTEIRRLPLVSGHTSMDARHDFDGDGVRDVVVQRLVLSRFEHYVLSGASGQVLWSPFENYAGWPSASLRTSTGSMRLLAGRNLYRKGAAGLLVIDDSLSIPEQLSSISVVPDMDGDGCEDLLVIPTASVSGWRLRAYSGATLSLIWERPGDVVAGFGHIERATALPDWNGDSVVDIAATRYVEVQYGPGTTAGTWQVEILSGVDGTTLSSEVSFDIGNGAFLGWDLAGIRDVSGDGRGELVVGHYAGAGYGTGSSTERAGRVVVLDSRRNAATEVGLRFCTHGQPNSTGDLGRMRAVGDGLAASTSLVLESSRIPVGQFGIFVASPDFYARDYTAPGLCLAGTIGRFSAPGQIVQADAQGRASLTINQQALPQGAGSVGPQPGETWAFQMWHRDTSGGAPSFAFTDGVTIQFR